jgi:hypothetical protein
MAVPGVCTCKSHLRHSEPRAYGVPFAEPLCLAKLTNLDVNFSVMGAERKPTNTISKPPLCTINRLRTFL